MLIGGRSFVVIPKCLREEVLLLGHAQFAAGHFGVDKTVRRIVDCCWWPGMSVDIENYEKNCRVCLCTKTDNRVKAKLGRRDFPTLPLDLISIGFVVDLPTSVNGNKHILTIVDQFSKIYRFISVT